MLILDGLQTMRTLSFLTNRHIVTGKRDNYKNDLYKIFI